MLILPPIYKKELYVMRPIQLVDSIRSNARSANAKRIRGLLEYVMAAILMIQCNTVWMTIEPFRGNINQVLLIALLGCAVCCMLLSDTAFSKKRWGLAISVIATLLLYLSVLLFRHSSNHSVFWHFLTCLFVILLYYVTCCDGGVPAVLLKYGQLVTWVAAYSLLMWMLCSILKILPPTGVVMTSWNDTAFMDAPINSYFGIYFETQFQNVEGTMVARNTSIFTEAPMASLHFSIALLIEALLKKKCDGKVFLLLTLAIVSTMSTTGYLMVMVAALIRLFAWLGKRGWLSNQALKAATLTVAGACFLFMVAIVFLKVETVSGSVRFDDMHAGALAVRDHFVFGNGFNNLPAIQRYMSSWRLNNLGFSSGLLWILSDGGLWLGMVHLLPMLAAVVMGIRRREVSVALFSVLMFFIFLITVFQYSLLLSFILVFLASYGNPLLKEESI